MNNKFINFIFSFRFLILVLWYLLLILGIAYYWNGVIDLSTLIHFGVYFLLPFLFIRKLQDKFILSTKTLFSISFLLFVILSLDYFINDRFLNFSFSLSVGFYFLMPIIRFAVNFSKIEEEQEKQVVSGFWIRFFGGFIVSFFAILFDATFFGLSIYSDIFLTTTIYFLLIFYIIAILTLKNPKI